MDTCVFAPILCGHEDCNQAYEALLRVCHKLVSSDRLFKQYQDVVSKKGYGTPYLVIRRLIELELMDKRRKVADDEIDSVQCNVPIHRKDEFVLKTAIAGLAQAIITEDRHFFEPKTSDRLRDIGIKVMRAKEYAREAEKL